MDEQALTVSPNDLYARLGTALAPVLVDVRRATISTDDRLIVGAQHPVPDNIGRWQNELAGRPVVAYCADGREVSPGVATALRAAGIKAVYLEGGLAGWNAERLPTRKNLGKSDKWVTREHPKIDRIACPWLISRFINPHAEFLYVVASDVFATAAETGATPYDVKDVEFGHVGDRCSFDAIVAAYDIHGPSLDHLATIVRGADTSRPNLTPQCEGLLAISHGLSANFPNDHEMLRHGLIIYDALYTWCRSQIEKRSGPSTNAA